VKKGKVKWLDRNIAWHGPYLTLCTSEEEYFSALACLGVRPIDEWVRNDLADATVHYCTNANDKEEAVVVCIRVNPSQSPIQVAGLLVHEAVHVWQRYCQRIGEQSPGLEQEAYAIQAISQTLMEEYALRIKA
jgi:hypothetical protein